MDLTGLVTGVALDAGCVAAGVCDADPFPEVERSMAVRLATGATARLRFTYADPVVATDVRRTYSWARAIVVGAWSYLPAAGSPGPSTAASGVVARFATEDHYRGLRLAMRRVAAALHDRDARAEVLIDDNRLVDRA
ncbi:MAG: hypothetical protein ACE5GC_09110, partial [Acidimicrobiia bacterium]